MSINTARVSFCFALLAIMVLCGSLMAGGYSIYLQLPGVKGGCLQKQHRGWMTIGNMSYSTAGRAGEGMPLPPGENLSTMFKFVKKVDEATPMLISAATSGKLFKDASIEFCIPAVGAFMQFRLSGVRVHRVAIEASPAGGKAPYVTFYLSYRKARLTYRRTRSNGSLAPPVEASWSCSEIPGRPVDEPFGPPCEPGAEPGCPGPPGEPGFCPEDAPGCDEDPDALARPFPRVRRRRR